MLGSKEDWLRSEPNLGSEHFQPSAEDREHLLSFWDAWDKAMAEQEKLMPMVARVIASGDIGTIKGAISWLHDAPHVARVDLIREWRRLSAAPAPISAPVESDHPSSQA